MNDTFRIVIGLNISYIQFQIKSTMCLIRMLKLPFWINKSENHFQ